MGTSSKLFWPGASLKSSLLKIVTLGSCSEEHLAAKVLYRGGSPTEWRGKPWLGDSLQVVFAASGRARLIIQTTADFLHYCRTHIWTRSVMPNFFTVQISPPPKQSPGGLKERSSPLLHCCIAQTSCTRPILNRIEKVFASCCWR